MEFRRASLRITYDNRGYIILFTVAFLIRILPELLSWPWLIGWDTPEYVANLKDFVVRPTILDKSVWYGGSRLLPPLLNVFLYPLTFLIDPWYIYKIIPPVIYGIETMAFYYLTGSLQLSREARYLSTLTFVFYPVSLRISWDLHRNSLGLIFLIGLLAEIIRDRNPWKILILSAGAFLSNEFTFVLAFLLLGVSLLEDLIAKPRSKEMIPKLLALLLGLLVLLVLLTTYRLSDVIYLSSRIDLLRTIQAKLVPTVLFFLPLLILLPIGLREMKDKYLLLFLIFTAFFAFSDILVPGLKLPVWNRWMYHLVMPLSIYASVGVMKVGGRSIYLLFILLLGVTFASAPYHPEKRSISALEEQIRLSGFSTDLSSVISVMREIGKGTGMTYTMMHTTVPIEQESDYMRASLHLADMKLDTLIVDFGGYGFVHIERRFGLNITPVHLSMEWKVPSHILRYLVVRGVSEFYVLGERGMRIILHKSSSFSLYVTKQRDFGSLTLYRCSIIRG